MPSALDYISALALGQQAATITKTSADAFTGSGYAALIQALTGVLPTVVDLGGGKARMVLNDKQVTIMKKWLEQRVAAGIKISKSQSNLDLNAGPFVMPVVLKYAFPAMVLTFALGWAASRFFGGK